MARARWWKDKRAWIEGDAKKAAQAYADKKSIWWRIACFFSDRSRKRFAKRRVERYQYALKYYTNRMAHTVYRRPEWERRAERACKVAAQRLREREIAEGKRCAIRFACKRKEA